MDLPQMVHVKLMQQDGQGASVLAGIAAVKRGASAEKVQRLCSIRIIV